MALMIWFIGWLYTGALITGERTTWKNAFKIFFAWPIYLALHHRGDKIKSLGQE